MKKNLEHVIEPVRAIANEAVDNILNHKRQFDFIGDFSSEITVKVLMKMMGLPVLEPADIRNKVVLAISTDRTTRGRNPELDAAFKWIADFIQIEVDKRRKDPQDDLVTPALRKLRSMATG